LFKVSGTQVTWKSVFAFVFSNESLFALSFLAVPRKWSRHWAMPTWYCLHWWNWQDPQVWRQCEHQSWCIWRGCPACFAQDCGRKCRQCAKGKLGTGHGLSIYCIQYCLFLIIIIWSNRSPAERILAATFCRLTRQTFYLFAEEPFLV
jgi:hypothetical protein